MGTASVQGDIWSGAPRDWAELQEPLFTPIYEAVQEGRRFVSLQEQIPVCPRPPVTGVGVFRM